MRMIFSFLDSAVGFRIRGIRLNVLVFLDYATVKFGRWLLAFRRNTWSPSVLLMFLWNASVQPPDWTVTKPEGHKIMRFPSPFIPSISCQTSRHDTELESTYYEISLQRKNSQWSLDFRIAGKRVEPTATRIHGTAQQYRQLDCDFWLLTAVDVVRASTCVCTAVEATAALLLVTAQQ